MMKDVYGRVRTYFEKNKADLTFTGLVPSERREDKITTFVPLLHLSNQMRLNLNQPVHFDEIYIKMRKKQSK
jgi:chromatin segregation and condensation protein Rec8/ScpA/Scc1 (kleisin family)